MRKVLCGGLAAALVAVAGTAGLVVHASCHPDSWAGRAVSLALGLGGRAAAVPHAARAAATPGSKDCAAPAACPVLVCDSLHLTPLPRQEATAVTAALCGRAGAACLAGRIVIDESTAAPVDAPVALMPAVRDAARGEPWAAGAEECDTALAPRTPVTVATFALMPHVEDDEALSAPGPTPELLPPPAEPELLAPPTEVTVETGAAPVCPAEENCSAEPGRPAPQLDCPQGCPPRQGACPCPPRSIKGREGHPGLEECEPSGQKPTCPKGCGVDTLEFRPSDASLSSIDLRGPF